MSYEPSHFETVAASQTAQVLGAAGAAGDFLDTVTIVVATAATAAVTILDGAVSISLFPNSPGGGIGTYCLPVRLRSQTGPWKVTTGAGSSVIASGTFT